MIRCLTILGLLMLLSACSTLSSIVDPVVNLVTFDSEPEPLNERKIQSITEQETRIAESKIADITAALNQEVVTTIKTEASADQDAVDQAINTYELLLSSTKSDAIRFESLQKLAQLSVIRAEIYLSDNDDENTQILLANADNYYQALQAEYPQQINDTEVKYQMARVKDLKGETDAARGLIDELATVSSDDSTIIEAKFRMAERLYSQKNYAGAQSLYDEVLAQDNRFYNSALFKRGWTHFQRENHDYALDDFVQLISRIYETPDQRSPVVDNLLNETYRVSSLSLSYLEGPQTLAALFNRIDAGQQPGVEVIADRISAYESDLYMRLAGLYEQQERLQDTANTYITFVRENPYTESAPLFEHRGIEVLSKSGFVDLVLEAKENFVLTYQTGSDYWFNTGYERSDEVTNILYEHLDQVMNYYHAGAQDSQTTEDYLKAAGWYEIFINSFPEHADLDNKRWLLAEVLFDAGEQTRSMAQYDILAYSENSLAKDRKEEAAYRIILSAQSNYDLLEDDGNITKLISESTRYLATFSDFQRSADVAAQTVELFLKQDDVSSAIALASQVVSSPFATPEQKQRSQIVIADGEYDLGNFMVAEIAYTELLNNATLSNDQRMSFKDRRAKSIFKQAEALKAAGQDQAAVAMFAHLARTEPESEERILGDYDSAMLLLAMNDYASAISMLNGFAANFPQHELAASVPAKLLLAYEATDNWGASADIYENMAANSTDPEIQRTALWQAAENRMKLTSTEALEASTMLWKDYIKRFPAPIPLALEARQHLIDIYGQMTAQSDQDLKWKQDFWRRKIITTVDEAQLTDVRARNLASDALISLVRDKFTTYEKLRLTQPLAQSLKKKSDLMQAILADYSKVQSYGIQGHVTEAAHHIGKSYALMASAMMDSERPAGMTELELEEYEFVLEEKVFPVEDQAIAAYENGIILTRDGIWDDWIEESYLALKKILPARYDKPEMVDDYAQ